MHYFVFSGKTVRRKWPQAQGSSSIPPSNEFMSSTGRRYSAGFSAAPNPLSLVSCYQCQEKLPPNALKAHISQCHSETMPFQCSLCGKGFLSVSGLNHHTLAHEGRKFICSICDSKFNQKAHLKSHLNKVHKLAQCPTCSLLFNVGDEFNKHLIQNH